MAVAMLCRFPAKRHLITKVIPNSFASAFSTSVESQDPLKGKTVSDKISMPDGIGHAVGPERYEMLTRLAGNEDPFDMNVKKRAKGTKDEPTLIPSMYDKRLVGCVCDDDTLSIVWMFLHRGEPRRCQCGYWFKIVDIDKSQHVEP